MLRFPICLIIATALAGCVQNDGPRFERMSPEDLALYNAEVPEGEKVFCFEEVRLGSHLKKRDCATQSELLGALESGFQTLGVLNADSASQPGRAIYSSGSQ